MHRKSFSSFALLLLLVLTGVTCFAQDEEQEEASKPTPSKRSKLRLGMFVGTLFPSNSSASFYDGWGYSINGNRNGFDSSFMKRSIIDSYGSTLYGHHDQIADALGVDQGQWSFNESDMPSEIRYSIAFALGVHIGFSLNGKNSIVFNFTTAKLTANGAFTITVRNTSPVAQQPGYQDIRTFGIQGSEQRFVFQLGYQHMFGEEGGFNFFTEGGPVCTLSKFLKNQIAINNLIIDLGSYYDQPQYGEFRKKYLSGLGFGAWAGLGFTTSYDARAVVQFTYDPALEVIAIGPDPSLSLQHYLGLKIYYSIWRRTIVKESF